MSELFLRTLRDDPADAEVPSHKLLIRAGYVRPVGPGLYSWLPLGLRVLRKVEKVVRDEMNAIGGQEILFPALLPKAPYEVDQPVDRIRRRAVPASGPPRQRLLLGPTHEELFALTVKGEYSSYKDFPLLVYQIQTKYRDEARPRAGILRGREFVMKDSYSFDVDDDGLAASIRSTATPTSGSSARWGCATSSSRRSPGRWAAARPRNSLPKARSARTPSCGAWNPATPPMSRR